MATEYKLSYTASDIDAKLGKIDNTILYVKQTLTEEQKAQARENIDALGIEDISLGIASDGLVYVFINGVPVGTGIPQGQSGDVFGYVDENNTIVLNGNLADGTYTIKYEMEDGSTIDIGNLVLDTNVYYSITSNLTNCTNSNNAKTVVEGEGYSATITANDGYELKSVSVTMGGNAVSASDGTISIASVTGNIVITAVAEEVQTEPEVVVNLIPTLTDIDLTTIYNDVGYKENTRISVSNISTSNPSGETTQANTTLLGIMPLGNDGDVLHLSGAKFFDNTGGNTYSGLIWYYNASGTLLNAGAISIPDTGLLSTDVNGDDTFTMTHSKMKLIDGTAYIRLNITNPTGELIMTRNQLISDSNVYHSVTNNLTNCTNSNSASEVIEGESYSATITANSGYELKTVSVTMGGSPVSVSGGIINISNVTGDIVITAVAEEIRVEITNLIPTLTDVDLSTIYNGTGYKENTRISISAVSDSNPTGEKTQADTTLLGIMPLGDDGDVLHLRGAEFITSEYGSYDGLIWYYDASGTLLNVGVGTINVGDLGLISKDVNGDHTFTLTHSKMRLIEGTAYIRFNITNVTGELIMTRNQLIPKD